MRVPQVPAWCFYVGGHPFGLKSQCRVGGRWGGASEVPSPHKNTMAVPASRGYTSGRLERGVVKDLSFFGGGGDAQKSLGPLDLTYFSICP